MPKKFWLVREIFLLIFVTIIVFITRLPFLFPGYGTDPDAWGVVYVAHRIASTGAYLVSRFPGYPVQEIGYSLFWRGGPWVINGLTALLSGLGAAFLALSIKKLGYKYAIVSGLTFAFVPVVFINSVNAMDYMWAMAFILGSLYFILLERPIIAGVFLGIAIGCRITSGAMALPLGLLLFIRKNNAKDLIKFGAVAFAVGGILFLPVIMTYGPGFLKYTQVSPIPFARVVSIATIEVWGIPGLVGLLTVAVYLFFRALSNRKFSHFDLRVSYPGIWGIAIIVYLIAFAMLPHEAGYLIPVVPFVILLINELSPPKIYLAFCIGLICSPFLVGIYSWRPIYSPAPANPWLNYSFKMRWNIHVFPFYGPLLYDHSFRMDEFNRFEKVISFGNGLKEKSVILVGWNLSKFAIIGFSENHNHELVEYLDLLDANQLHQYLNSGYKIYYLPEMLQVNKDETGINLDQYGGVSIPID